MGKKRIFAWAAAAAVVAAAFRVSFPVSAAVTDIVQLTPEQTLALYGDVVSAQYYNTSNSWSDCTFQFLGFSEGLVSTGNNLSAGGYSDTSLFSGTWLWYGFESTQATDIQDNNVSFEFRFVPSVNVQGVAYFRQIIGSVRSSTHGSGYDPWRSSYYAACFTSYSASSVVFNGRGLDMSTTDSAANVYFTPAPLDDANNILADRNECAFSDIYLQNLVDGVEQTFDYTGLVFRPTRSPLVDVYEMYQGYQRQNSYYLICMSCPELTDGYVLPDVPTTAPSVGDQLDDILQQGAANQTLLQQILAKLDLIYQKNYSVNVNVDSSSIVSGIVDGIKGLFVPTQSDILNFRLSMMTLCNDSLSPFYDVEQLRDTAINRIMSAPMVNYVDLPLVDLTGAGVDFKMTAADFPDYQVIDNNVRVPLKVGSDWSFFYELVAWGLDVICTLAFVNMVINKLHAFFLGDKVVEIDDN